MGWALLRRPRISREGGKHIATTPLAANHRTTFIPTLVVIQRDSVDLDSRFIPLLQSIMWGETTIQFWKKCYTQRTPMRTGSWFPFTGIFPNDYSTVKFDSGCVTDAQSYLGFFFLLSFWFDSFLTPVSRTCELLSPFCSIWSSHSFLFFSFLLNPPTTTNSSSLSRM
jgi:hypothetical protein